MKIEQFSVSCFGVRMPRADICLAIYSAKAGAFVVWRKDMEGYLDISRARGHNLQLVYRPTKYIQHPSVVFCPCYWAPVVLGKLRLHYFQAVMPRVNILA